MVRLYQEAASQLQLRLAEWNDCAADREALAADARAVKQEELVETCETIIARENESWRAEWLSVERVKGALAAVEATRTAARDAAV